MGANAQTSVPLFVANAVLTAAQQNISAATGVPVFATTVTRDAAFGGSNKVLAAGQLCYLESTAVVQQYNGTAWVTVGPSAAAGLVCVKAETAFSAVASFTVDSIFTSTYTNYKIMLRYTTSTSTNDVYMQLRVGGVAAATNYAYQYLQANSTGVTAANASAQTSGYIGLVTNGDYPATVAMELFSPFVATNTGYQVHNQITYAGFTNAYIKDTYGVHSTGTAYDGLALSVATGTMSGTYTIYGYSKTV